MKKSAIFLIIIWLLLTAGIACSILSFVTPKKIDLGSVLSCGLNTVQECLTGEAVPRATADIQASFVESLKSVQRIASIFSFPLGILEFEQVIVNEGSAIQLRVSAPKYEKPVLSNAEIVCSFRGNVFVLKSGERRSTELYIQLFTLINEDSASAEKSLKEVAASMVSGYEGCDWVPVDIRFADQAEKIVVGPNETVSIVKVLKPFLVYYPTWLTILIIAFGSVVFVGAFFAIIQQLVRIITKGFRFFTD